MSLGGGDCRLRLSVVFLMRARPQRTGAQPRPWRTATPGLFLLRKDSERRAVLYRILWGEQNQLASNLQECVAQVQAECGSCNPTPSAQGQVPSQKRSKWDWCSCYPRTFAQLQEPP